MVSAESNGFGTVRFDAVHAHTIPAKTKHDAQADMSKPLPRLDVETITGHLATYPRPLCCHRGYVQDSLNRVPGPIL